MQIVRIKQTVKTKQIVKQVYTDLHFYQRRRTISCPAGFPRLPETSERKKATRAYSYLITTLHLSSNGLFFVNLHLSPTALESLRKRLRHQSAQRGMRELDLLLGAWAEKHLADLSEPELLAYEQILTLGEPVLWHFLREASAPVPEDLDASTQALLVRIRADSIP